MGDKTLDKDTELINRARDGDRDAFRTLVNLYKDRSLSLAISIMKDETLSEDVLQEAFIKVYKKIGGFKSRSKFSTWLYRIVVNTSFNKLKERKDNVPIEENDDLLNVTEFKDHHQPLRMDDQKKYINMAMARLKPNEALVLRLFYLCEMSLNEIASISGFSASKVRVDLHRGRKNMEQQLKRLLGKEINSLL